MKHEFLIEPHSGIDKGFSFSNRYIGMYVDYDDVYHEEVDAAVETMKEILDKHWDQDLFKSKFREKLIDKWNKNRYNLQSDYDSFEDYCKQHGI